MLPRPNSPADDVIPGPTTLSAFAVCPIADQRGHARPGLTETRCTIGAAEVQFKNPTTTAVTVSPTQVTAGQRVIYLAVVNQQQTSIGDPTGTITFTARPTDETHITSLCQAVLVGTVAACGAYNAPATGGPDTVTGTYSGGGGFAASTSTARLVVFPGE